MAGHDEILTVPGSWVVIVLTGHKHLGPQGIYEY